MPSRFPAAALLAAGFLAIAAPPAPAESAKTKDIQVALEVRILAVAEDCCSERVGVEFGNEPFPPEAFCLQGVEALQSAAAPAMKATLLSDLQTHLLLEAVQGDARTHVVQLPKVTLFDGQTGVLKTCTQQPFSTGVGVVPVGKQTVVRPKTASCTTGLCLTAKPVVSADRRFVQVDLRIENAGLMTPLPATSLVQCGDGQDVPCAQLLRQPARNIQCVHTTATIPDGGTVLLGGLKTVREVRKEYGPPVISRIPYLNRVFRTVGTGRETQQVFVLVTPRILVPQGEEERSPALASAPQSSPCPTRGVGATVASSPGCPVLSGIPHLGHLFQGVGYGRDTRELLLMVSPRVLIDEEEEETVAPNRRENEASAACRKHQAAAAAELVKGYQAACDADLWEEAKKIARMAVDLDPTCFQRK